MEERVEIAVARRDEEEAVFRQQSQALHTLQERTRDREKERESILDQVSCWCFPHFVSVFSFCIFHGVLQERTALSRSTAAADRQVGDLRSLLDRTRSDADTQADRLTKMIQEHSRVVEAGSHLSQQQAEQESRILRERISCAPAQSQQHSEYRLCCSLVQIIRLCNNTVMLD